MPAVITTNGLARRFGEIAAVDGLSIEIGAGEMFGLVGPDGSGKTTTIRLLCGILAPSAGGATILGHDLLREPDLIKREIGYLSQRFSLYGDLTIDENIEFFAEINRVYDYRARREELLAFTRLTPFRDRLAEKLSGGMKQKLALACTLVHTPKIILLDEPTTGVDPVSRRDFWRILQSLLKSGITIVMSTPYLDEAERCTRVALMNGGRAMEVDTPAAIRATMRAAIVEVVCEPVREGMRVLSGLPGVGGVQAFGDRLHVVMAKPDQAALTAALAGAGVVVGSIRPIAPSLEDVFIDLLSHDTKVPV